MKTLQKKAKKLQELNTLVRKGVKELMYKWEEISDCGEEIVYPVVLLYDRYFGADTQYYLITGKNEIQHYSMGDEYKYVDADTKDAFWNVFSMSDLRKFLANFENAVNEIEKKIEAKLAIKYDLIEKIMQKGA